MSFDRRPVAFSHWLEYGINFYLSGLSVIPWIIYTQKFINKSVHSDIRQKHLLG